MSRGDCDATALAVSAQIASARGAFEVAVRRFDDAEHCAKGALGERALGARLAAHLDLAARRLKEGRLAVVAIVLAHAAQPQAGYKLQATRYKLQVTTYKLQTTS